MTGLTDIQRRLIDGWQRDFPLHPTPYARIAFSLGVSELSVIGTLSELCRAGIVSRVGAVVAPNTAGASTLAAMAVPPERLESVAAIVNEEPGVNHNYEREHRYNLWFVITGRDRRALDGALARIRAKTGLDVLDLPLRTAYHIDLGFPLEGSGKRNLASAAPHRGESQCHRLMAEDRRLLQAIEDGLPLMARPYAEVARGLGTSESGVIERLKRLTACGVIKRLGLVVRHRELGYRANAMVVWDIDDRDIDAVGEAFAAFPFVTLCYRRPRRAPAWPYNLFCMIHGRDRETVLGQIEALRACAPDAPMDVLFSRRRFKQRGARLSVA